MSLAVAFILLYLAVAFILLYLAVTFMLLYLAVAFILLYLAVSFMLLYAAVVTCIHTTNVSERLLHHRQLPLRLEKVLLHNTNLLVVCCRSSPSEIYHF
jgi:hypothetical protein